MFIGHLGSIDCSLYTVSEFCPGSIRSQTQAVAIERPCNFTNRFMHIIR